MTTEEMKSKTREWYKLIEAERFDEAKEYCSDDFVFYPMLTKKIEGAEKFVALESAHMSPCPGYKLEVINMIAEGDWVAVQLEFDGTLAEDNYLGVPVVKRRQHHDVMTWVRFNEEGKICEKRAKYNEYNIYKQHEIPEIMAFDEKLELPIKYTLQ